MNDALHPSARKFAGIARDRGLDVAIREFDQTTRTAQDAADAIGCQLGQIVKSLLFLVAREPVMALVSGTNQLDERKLAALRGVSRKQVQRSNADQTKAITGFTIGGVPPFGHATPLPVYVDESLLQFDQVWAAAGTPHAVFPVAPRDLVRAANGSVADLKRP